MILSPLCVFVPLGVVMYITRGSPTWWMVASALLMLINSSLTVYMAHRLYRTGALPDSPKLHAVGRALSLAALLCIVVPVYGPRVLALFH